MSNLEPSQDWFAYMRVSGDAQRDKQTIETQRREIERTGLVPADHIFADDGVSGVIHFIKRPGSRTLRVALNEHAKSGRTPHLLLNYLDRLGRDGRDTLNTAMDLIEAGWGLRTIFEGNFENTPEGRLKVMMYSGMAESARFRIIRGTGDGLRKKAEEGGYTGGFIAFGYRKEGEGKHAHIVQDTAPLPGLKLSRSQIVHIVFVRAADGESCRKIADWLNALGVPPSKQNLRASAKTGRESIWRPNSVRVILTNPIYTGRLQWGRRSWVGEKPHRHLKINPPDHLVKSATCPAIVDEDLWQRANAALHQNQLQVMAHAKSEYLLRGLIRCSLCGCKYTGRGTHYACIGRHCGKRLWGNTRPPCEARPIRRADIEGAVWDQIETFLRKPGAALRQLESQIRAESKNQTIANDIATLEARLKLLENAAGIAYRQVTRGMASEAQYDAEVASIKRDKAVVEEQLAGLRKLAADRDADARALGEARSLLETLRAKQDSPLSFEHRRRIVEALVEGVTAETIPGQRQPKFTVTYRFQPHFERYFGRREAAPQFGNASSYVPA